MQLCYNFKLVIRQFYCAKICIMKSMILATSRDMLQWRVARIVTTGIHIGNFHGIPKDSVDPLTLIASIFFLSP